MEGSDNLQESPELDEYDVGWTTAGLLGAVAKEAVPSWAVKQVARDLYWHIYRLAYLMTLPCLIPLR
jgi:hypothetical protein